jgi:hypothetical protein
MEVTIPSEGIQSQGPNNESILLVAAVADSYVYNVQMLPTWKSLFPNIFSCVLNISVLEAGLYNLHDLT